MVILPRNRYAAIDLFSGCGGLSLGLSNAGFDIILANELNEDAASTYVHNLIKKAGHDTKIIVDDVCHLSTERILEIAGGRRISLVAAGPPCQGFSLAGRRDMNDPRNSLFKQLVRIVKEIKPPLFLMENVKGILTMDGGRVIEAIIDSFEKVGYNVQIKVLRSSEYGVPQIRERVFIIGTTYECKDVYPKPRIKHPISVKDAISDLSFLRAGQSSKDYLHSPESRYQELMRRHSSYLTNHDAARHSQKVINRFSKLKPGETAHTLPPKLRTRKMVLFRLHPDQPARTIVTLPDDYVHYLQDRILTVREMARLQSFPDSFEFLGPKSTGGKRRKFEVPQYTQVGNAVPPLLAQAVGEQLITCLEENGFRK